MVRRVEPTAAVSAVLQRGDVLLGFDGVDIGSDGTVPFRSGERIGFSYLISQKYTGEKVGAGVEEKGALLCCRRGSAAGGAAPQKGPRLASSARLCCLPGSPLLPNAMRLCAALPPVTPRPPAPPPLFKNIYKKQAKLRILHEGRVREVEVALRGAARLVPIHINNRPPSYYIIGGLVFTPVTVPLLRSEYGKGARWWLAVVVAGFFWPPLGSPGPPWPLLGSPGAQPAAVGQSQPMAGGGLAGRLLVRDRSLLPSRRTHPPLLSLLHPMTHTPHPTNLKLSNAMHYAIHQLHLPLLSLLRPPHTHCIIITP